VEEVKADLVEAALCVPCQCTASAGAGAGNILFGTANSKRSFKLLPKMSVKKGRLLLPCRALCAITSVPLTPLVRAIVLQIYKKRNYEGGMKGRVLDLRVDEVHPCYPSTEFGV
jgi:hypothetical protein